MTPGDQRVVVIGGSAGALEPLREVVAHFPAGLPAAVLALIHLPSTAHSHLAQILDRVSEIPVGTAVDGEPLVAGRVYVARPDHHLLVHRDRVAVTRGPKENGVRPAIDPLFRTAARYHGPNVVAALLCGLLDDGSGGMARVADRGGHTVVLDPEDCAFEALPANAVRCASPRHVARRADLPGLLRRLAEQPAVPVPPVAMEDPSSMSDADAPLGSDGHPGRPSGYSCPDCSGVLFDLGEEGGAPALRCRTGHRYTGESLLEQQSVHIEGALWAAVRALEEQASLTERLADRYARAGSDRWERRFRERSRVTRQQSQTIRVTLLSEPSD